MNPSVAQPNSLWARLVARVRNSMPFRYPDLGLICLGAFIELVGVGAIVPIRSIYARDHGATPDELGLIGSAFLLGSFLFQFPGGWASDKWGRKPLLVAGIAIAGVISLLFLLSDNPWYFIVLRFVEGAAGGAIGPASNAYVMDAVPSKERGAAFGWLGSAFSAGFMMGPAIGGVMVDHLGYASPFYFGAAMSLLTALFLAVKMTNRKPGEKAVPVEEEASPNEPKAAGKELPKGLFAPALVAALALTAASGFGDGLFISIWTIWLNDLHASNSFIGLTFVTFSLPLMLLMPMTGKMADKRTLLPLITIPGMLISTVYLAYGFTENLLVIAGLGLLEGTFVAIMLPAISAFVANLSPDNARGRLQGAVSTARTVAGFVSSMLVARLYYQSTSYPFFMLAGTQLIISMAAGVMIWQIEKRKARTAVAQIKPLETRQSAPVLESAAK